MADALLSDLCSICNTATFKYRCPGCAARTCSLPCYKRHQQWAQCNGKRDPIKYVKKSQLATPAGIDHDYNFLTNIERGLEKAERHVEGSLGSLSDSRRDAHGRQPLHRHFAAAGVTVIRAPKGLSRQKENKTHRNKKGSNIVWTVEWIREDTTRILTESTSASTILHIQPFKSTTKTTRKRKRDVDPTANTLESADQDASVPTQSKKEASDIKAEGAQIELLTSGHSEPGQVNVNVSTGDGTTGESNEIKGSTGHDGDVRVDGSDPEPAKYSFYLVRPRTSSNRNVLIPLDPTATLADCLRGRTVLEFPTIYVFPIGTVPPSSRFMLESEYIKQEGEDEKEFEELIKNVSPETLRALKEQDDNDNAGDEIDSNKILDVLKQDIAAAV